MVVRSHVNINVVSLLQQVTLKICYFMVFTQSMRSLLEREKHRTPASPDENWASHSPLLTGQSNNVFSVPLQFTLPSVYGPLPENTGYYMWVRVLLHVLNELRKMDKCEA